MRDTNPSSPSDWAQATAQLSDSYGTAKWDGLLTVHFDKGPDPGKPILAIVDDPQNCSKVFFDQRSVWCRGPAYQPGGAKECGQSSGPDPHHPPIEDIDKVSALAAKPHLVTGTTTGIKSAIAGNTTGPSIGHGGNAAAEVDAALAEAIAEEFKAIDAIPFSTVGYSPETNLTKAFSCSNVKIAFADHGGITLLSLADSNSGSTDTAHAGKTAKRSMASWASALHPIAQPFYQAQSGDYFKQFNKDYNLLRSADFAKPNLNNHPTVSANASVVSMMVKRTRSSGAPGCSFVIGMSMGGEAHTERGAPSTLAALIDIGISDDGSQSVDLAYTLQWYNKTATHIPETFWLLNRPIATNTRGWRLRKLGSDINPLDADLGYSSGQCNPHDGPTTCGVHLHAVQNVSYSGPEGSFQMTSLDSMLVSVGEPIQVPTPLKPPDMQQNATHSPGVHFSLVDNTWNTNAPVWYPFDDERDDSSSQFRFRYTLTPHLH